jgi:hypothetical protein
MNARPEPPDGLRAPSPAGPAHHPLASGHPDPRVPAMIDALARIRFTWDAQGGKCRATAYDVAGRTLGEVVVDLPEDVRKRIWLQRGASAQLRIEEIAEKHLRAMLELRY